VTLYEVLLFIHILAAMVWVGGSIMLFIVTGRVDRTGDAQFRARFMTTAAVVGPVIGASSFVVLGAGIWMVLERDAIELSQTWIWLALILFGVTAIGGLAYFGPASKRIVAALEAGQMEEADRRARTFSLASRLDTLLLLVIVGLMVFKPGI
jgi:uncharacterized membrane protein